MNKSVKSFAASALLLTGHTILADTVFNTVPSWDGVNSINSWGNPNSATYGQTFIAPADPILTRFDFYISSGIEQSTSFKPFVMEWDGPLQGTGGGGDAMVWLGSSVSLLGTGAFQQVTINVPLGAATLTPGMQYIIGLTVTDPADFGNTDGTSVWGRLGFHDAPSVSGGGGFKWDNGADGGIPALSGPWDTFFDGGDLAFRAEFTSAGAEVPEPGTYAAATLMLGALGLSWVRRGQR